MFKSFISKFFFTQLGNVLKAIMLLALAVFMAVAIFSYYPYDHSLNLASSGVIHNKSGKYGAYLADLLLQSLGASSILLIFAPFIWGGKHLVQQKLPHFLFRIFWLMLAIICISCVLAAIPTPKYWFYTSMGGAIGELLLNLLSNWTYQILILSASFFIGVICYIFSLGLSVWELQSLTSVLAILFNCIALIYRIITFIPRKLFFSKSVEIKNIKEASPRIGPRLSKSDNTSKIKPENKKDKLSVQPIQTNFEIPSINLLNNIKSQKNQVNPEKLTQNAKELEKVLEDFGIYGKISNISPGPVVTLYEFEPSAGTKSARVIGLADDIARSMSSIATRIAVISGKNALGIELPNPIREIIYLREIIEKDVYQSNENKLPIILGKDIAGADVIVDLSRMPHLLVAGTTGSGKSVAINTMILSLLYKLTPEQCRFIMIDPKMLELSVYDGIPHLLTPVVTEPGKAVTALKWTVKEMENRYRLMSNLAVRNIAGYNQKLLDAQKNGEVLERTVQTGFDPHTGQPIMEKIPFNMDPLPFIVVIVDEMADLMLVAGKDIETSVQRLAQMARAAGIHIIMATQRPSVDVITGVIKANFPTRISFQVTSRIDSRTILGEQGAEQLLGMGDMLYMAGGGRVTRVHGPFVDDTEVEKVVSFLKLQSPPTYLDAVTKESDDADVDPQEGGEYEQDGLYDKAVVIITKEQKASTSFIQRSLRIGYNRAASIMERMEKEGVVSSANHVGKREVLIPPRDEI